MEKVQRSRLDPETAIKTKDLLPKLIEWLEVYLTTKEVVENRDKKKPNQSFKDIVRGQEGKPDNRERGALATTASFAAMDGGNRGGRGGRPTGQWSAGDSNGQGQYCIFCESRSHWSTRCQVALADPKKAFDIACRLNACKLCLQTSHRTRECTREVTCEKCGKLHHHLVHLPKTAMGARNSGSSQ